MECFSAMPPIERFSTTQSYRGLKLRRFSARPRPGCRHLRVKCGQSNDAAGEYGQGYRERERESGELPVAACVSLYRSSRRQGIQRTFFSAHFHLVPVSFDSKALARNELSPDFDSDFQPYFGRNLQRANRFNCNNSCRREQVKKRHFQTEDPAVIR